MTQVAVPNDDPIEFLGMRFASLEPAAALDAVFALANRDLFTYVVTPNVAHIVELHQAPQASRGDLERAYAQAALRLCDSRVLAGLARRSGLWLPVVPGSDLTIALLDAPRLRHRKVAIVGSTESAVRVLRELVTDVEFAQLVPPMGVRHDLAAQLRIVEFVERTQADIVLFALGAPQSELLANQIERRGRSRGVGLCIGAAIDFAVGSKRRAPVLLQQLHLEWAHRLASEPRRLWRRYLLEGPKIFVLWRRWSRHR